MLRTTTNYSVCEQLRSAIQPRKAANVRANLTLNCEKMLQRREIMCDNNWGCGSVQNEFKYSSAVGLSDTVDRGLC